MTKSDYCSDCPWNYEGFANNLILPRASDLNLCEEQDPDNPDCHRHDEWLEITEEKEVHIMIQTQEKPLITERLTEEDLSAATLDQIISKGEEVYQRWEELCELSDPEKFCEECEHRYTVREREEYWGSTCYREFETCKAEFDPDSSDCPYCDEFFENVKEKRECEALLERLDEIQEKLETEESA